MKSETNLMLFIYIKPIWRHLDQYVLSSFLFVLLIKQLVNIIPYKEETDCFFIFSEMGVKTTKLRNVDSIEFRLIKFLISFKLL
jgi:hypothetical protein